MTAPVAPVSVPTADLPVLAKCGEIGVDRKEWEERTMSEKAKETAGRGIASSPATSVPSVLLAMTKSAEIFLVFASMELVGYVIKMPAPMPAPVDCVFKTKPAVEMLEPEYFVSSSAELGDNVVVPMKPADNSLPRV